MPWLRNLTSLLLMHNKKVGGDSSLGGGGIRFHLVCICICKKRLAVAALCAGWGRIRFHLKADSLLEEEAWNQTEIGIRL